MDASSRDFSERTSTWASDLYCEAFSCNTAFMCGHSGCTGIKSGHRLCKQIRKKDCFWRQDRLPDTCMEEGNDVCVCTQLSIHSHHNRTFAVVVGVHNSRTCMNWHVCVCSRVLHAYEALFYVPIYYRTHVMLSAYATGW